MSTGRDMIKGALRLLGVYASGETPSSEDQADGLLALNEMLDDWSTEKLMIPARVREEFTLVSGTQSYTIGSSGTFNTTKPLRVVDATIEDQAVSPTIESPLVILRDPSEWATIPIKDTTAGLPTKFYIEDAYPLATIYLWTKPDSNKKLVLYSDKPLSSVATVNTTISVGPGYWTAMKYNLAIRLAPEYGKEPSILVIDRATKAMANIKRLQTTENLMTTGLDKTVGRRYDINKGE